MPRPRRPAPKSPPFRRIALFAVIALAIVGVAAFELAPKRLAEDTSAAGPTAGGAAAYELTVRVDMAGFMPANLSVPAGRPVRLRIVNPDTSMHSDGGGWHQLAVPALGIDAKVAPLTTKTIEIPASAAGEYDFYCDVCCGGKENPSMQGKLRVHPA